MTHFLYHWGWANGSVGNFAAGIIVTTLATVLIKKLRLHDKARRWLHRPLHARLDAQDAALLAQDEQIAGLHAKHDALHRHLGMKEED